MQADKDPGVNETDSITPAGYPDPDTKFLSDNQKNM